MHHACLNGSPGRVPKIVENPKFDAAQARDPDLKYLAAHAKAIQFQTQKNWNPNPKIYSPALVGVGATQL